MPNKPGKYGILIRTLSDAQYRYMCNLEVYPGKDPLWPQENRGPTANVMNLTRPYHYTGRSVTFDRYYTSIDLATKLHEVDLTMTGTLTQNRVNIPDDAKKIAGRPLNSNLFFFVPFDHLRL